MEVLIQLSQQIRKWQILKPGNYVNDEVNLQKQKRLLFDESTNCFYACMDANIHILCILKHLFYN